MKSSAPSRVINLGSRMHRWVKIDFEDLQSEENYGAMRAYAKAKLMVVMHTYELARRLEGTGVTANVVEPGFVATNLGRNSGSLLIWLGFIITRPFQISARKAARTIVYLASSDEAEGVSGRCYSKMREITTSPISYDRQMQERLWNATVKLIELTTKH